MSGQVLISTSVPQKAANGLISENCSAIIVRWRRTRINGFLSRMYTYSEFILATVGSIREL